MPAKQCTGTLQMEDMFAQDDNCNIINYNGKNSCTFNKYFTEKLFLFSNLNFLCSFTLSIRPGY